MRFRLQIALRAAVYISACAILVAQGKPEQDNKTKKHDRYVMVDLGTFGGPNSFVNGPLVPVINKLGEYAGEAETSIPDPHAPNCRNEECLLLHAQRWRDGVVSDLGSLPGLNNSLASWGPNEDGSIAGVSQNGLIDPLIGIPEMRAVSWTKNGEIVDLGTLPGGTESFATSSNNRGEIVGWSTNAIPDPFSIQGLKYQTRAFLWRNGKMQDLGTLGGPDSSPQVINGHGQVAGVSYVNSTPNTTTGFPTEHPFLWGDGIMRDLGSLGGTFGNADSLNDRGQVVGWTSLPGDSSIHPYLWERGVMRDLGTFGGTNGQAIFVNAGGDVVGLADTPGDAAHHAFLYKDGVKTDLGTIGDDPCSNGWGINSQRQIVGNSTNCHGATLHVFLWEDGEMMDLNKLLVGGADIKLDGVWYINDRGEIPALHVFPNGNVHAAILVPCDDNHAHVDGCKGADSAPMNVGPPWPGTRDAREFAGPKTILDRIRAQRVRD